MKDTTKTFKHDLKDFVLKNKEGFTINFMFKKPQHNNGFYVALTDNSDKNLNRAVNNLLFLKEKKFNGISPLFIGGWIDEKTNIFYIDLSVFIETEADAITIAQLFKQKAIWDIKNLKSIYV